jgi:hypothetical protein
MWLQCNVEGGGRIWLVVQFDVYSEGDDQRERKDRSGTIDSIRALGDQLDISEVCANEIDVLRGEDK